MAEEEAGSGTPAKTGRSINVSWSRVGSFILNILRLESSVEALKKENADLMQRIDSLQRELLKQSGQLSVLSDFVNKALEDRVRTQAEEAAVRAFERMVALTGSVPAKRGRKEGE